MSFLSVLGHIGHIFTATTNAIAPLAPAIETIPGWGSVFGTVFGAIVAVEHLVPQDGAGAAKKAAVTSIVQAAQPGVDTTALSSAIDNFVAALNALQKLMPSPKP